MPVRVAIQQGDITTMEVDAIVNSANNDLVLGGGVSGALRRLGGPAIQEECNQIGTVPLGEAVVTSGGSLKCKWIIHAVTNPLGLWADARSIRNAIRNVFKRTVDKQIRTVAIPAIGAGAGGFSIDRCADVLLDELAEHLKGAPTVESVTFVLYDEKNYKAFEERFMRKMPDAWCAMTGKPLPEIPPDEEPEPEPMLEPPPRPLPQRPIPQGRRPRPPQGRPQGPQQGRPSQPAGPQGGPGGPPKRRRRRGRGRNRPPGGPGQPFQGGRPPGGPPPQGRPPGPPRPQPPPPPRPPAPPPKPPGP